MSVQARGNGHGVPFVDLNRQHAPLAAELRSTFDRVVSTDAFVLGSEVEAFEREFAAYSEASHCVGVGSGTAAIALALIAAGIGPGDEVVVPAHTFIASVLGVLHAGALPVFCDVQRDTGLIDPDSAASVVGPRTSAGPARASISWSATTSVSTDCRQRCSASSCLTLIDGTRRVASTLSGCVKDFRMTSSCWGSAPQHPASTTYSRCDDSKTGTRLSSCCARLGFKPGCITVEPPISMPRSRSFPRTHVLWSFHRRKLGQLRSCRCRCLRR